MRAHYDNVCTLALAVQSGSENICVQILFWVSAFSLHFPVTKLPLVVTAILWESTGAVPCRKPCVSPSELGLLTEPRVTPLPMSVGLV